MEDTININVRGTRYRADTHFGLMLMDMLNASRQLGKTEDDARSDSHR